MSGDDFAEKAAEMQRPIKKFIPGARTIAYGIGFFLLFGLAAGQVGLTSQQLQKYGDPVVRYPNAQTKHLVGLLLFSGIASLLIALGSPYLPLYFLAFIVFAISVIDITSAGLLHHQLPFGTKCNGNGGNYGVWTGFVSDCKIYTGLEGVSWAKWAVGLIIAVALFADAFTHAKKHHKRHYVYGQPSLHPKISSPSSGSHSSRTTSEASSSTADLSVHKKDDGSSNTFASFFGKIGRGVKAAANAGSEPTHHPARTSSSPHREPKRSNMVGASSRGAGVRPKRSVTAGELPLTAEASNGKRDAPAAAGYNGPPLAGPSRGGFIVQTHAKTAATVATTKGDGISTTELAHVSTSSSAPSVPQDTSRSKSMPPQSLGERRFSVEVLPTTAPMEIAPNDAGLPPSVILARISDLAATNPRSESYLPLLKSLARAVSLYPFPPPTLSASSLSEALSLHPTQIGSTVHFPGASRPPPTPAQIYVSQAHRLSTTSPPAIQAIMLELMVACINASLESTGGMKELDKAVFWEEARRWSEDAKVEVDDGQGSKRRALSHHDREALVKVLAALSRGGRDLSDVPGLVALLCSFVTDCLPSPRPPSPLFDPKVMTPFTRRVPHVPSPHASSLALITALHKFSAPHIYTASTLLAIRAALEIAKLQEEQDIGGSDGVLAFITAVVRFGEVTGRKAARRRARPTERDATVPQDGEIVSDANEGDEILREVVSVVARLIGCEGLVSVVELRDGQSFAQASVNPACLKTSILPPLALDLMRDLIRSPANQATKSLRRTLIAPPATGPRPPCPILLLVGSLRSLRKAMVENTAEVEAAHQHNHDSGMSGNGESRWPSLLSLGLPFLWNGIKRVMQWESGRVNAEVMRLVEERLDASERLATKLQEAASKNAAGTTDHSRPGYEGGGVTYEEWSMAIEVLDKAKMHVRAWEQAKLRQWLLADEVLDVQAGNGEEGSAARGFEGDSDEEEPEEDEPGQFTRRPDVLTAFSSLLRKVIRAWQTPGFTGSSEAVFALLVSLAPHLSDSYARIVLDQSEAACLLYPSHPEWLERTQEVVKSFYVLPSRAAGGKAFRQGVSASTRRRTLQVITALHSHLRPLPNQCRALVDEVITPLLETSLESETDATVAEVMIGMVKELGRDALVEDSKGTDGTLRDFDSLRLRLVKMARQATRTFDRGTPSQANTPLFKRTAGFSPISRYAGSVSSSPSLRRNQGPSAASVSTALDPPDVSALAVTGLISVFHLCLEASNLSASAKAVVIFRDLLALLSPAAANQPDQPVASLRTRLLILQWLVRLRADASHRIHWVPEVDISGPAQVISRHAVASETSVSEGPIGDAKGSEDGQAEARGRSSRQVSGVADRSRSTSRLRTSVKDERSPSRNGSIRRPSTAPVVKAPMLWTLPEVVPFDIGSALCAVGAHGLASFDHNRMKNWTEEEDPGTGTMKLVITDEDTPSSDWIIVLPVSEYLHTLVYIIEHDQEWELVSYILCHLPEQLSNKHFACGPRCAQQIHILRKFLCDALRAGDRGEGIFPRILPAGIKRAEIHALAFHCLTALIAYRSLFSKQHQDEMVDTFMYGLGNPRDTAKPCIHALAMAVFELRPSMTKHLAETVRHLQKIISSATLGVHILEFIAGVGQLPAVYANFTDVDFQTVFGIALKYIQAHNERLADDPASAARDDGIDYAFSQYVLLLAYYNIAIWYLAVRLSERPKFIPFLTRRLIQANEGNQEVDEATEVMFDMLARYAYSNADPRPRATSFDKLVSGPASSIPPKTWIVGHATITIRKLNSPAWVEVTIRRASGVLKMMWEMQNISMTGSAPENDLVRLHLRHRETAGLMDHTAPSMISSALSEAASPRNPRPLARLTRSASFSGSSSTALSATDTIVDNTVNRILNSLARDISQLTLESGVLTVDPSFFPLQLSSFPDMDPSDRPVLVPNDPASQRGVTALDRMPIVDFHKIGVLYAGPGQTREQDILANTHGSKAYVEFIAGLGQLVRLQGSRESEIYAGGLDQDHDVDGRWTYVWDDDISQIVFHIATLMPTSLDTDPLCTLKKRHIGNDFVKVIWNDSGGEFAFDTLPGDFNFVNIVIQPHTPAGNPWVGPGMTNNADFFKVSMQCRPGMPEVGPLGTFKMVTGSSLPSFVRQLALHSNIFAQIFLASVGFEARQGTNQKIEYSSNWRKRLQQIKMLKKRILDQAQGGPATTTMTGKEGSSQGHAEPPQRVDLDQAEASRLFTAWL
ncbi:uncharacterized protein JCM15063_005247 [Sporobolomyces koalae]|uniref:uncharacterized protein n=1 Tax=Sporobolomyces koalae TaxID=500713 RepID=UPI0031787B09